MVFGTPQTGLTGSTNVDMHTMFTGDNVVTHMNKLFDGQSLTRSICADEQVSEWVGDKPLLLVWSTSHARV